MYESLKVHMGDFQLFIFAFDDLSYRILQGLALDNVTVISLEEFENQELLAVKNDRSTAEYCWTCTPATISFVIHDLGMEECTYLDADLMFYSNPEVLLEELKSDGSVLITEHRYSFLPRILEEKRAGRYCVQFISFNQTSESKEILNTWKNQCIEWCYNRYEDGKFGDQKYLDVWPVKYRNIHILNHLGGGVAPWNIGQYKIVVQEDQLIGISKKTGVQFPLVFYHFQYVKLLESGWADLGWHSIPGYALNLLYKPYLHQLQKLEKLLTSFDKDYRTKFHKFKSISWRDHFKNGFKELTKYNLYNYWKQ